MGFQNYISYKLFTNTNDIEIEQFSFLAIKNQGSGEDTITLSRGDSGDTPINIWPLKAGEPFSFPLQGSAYDIVKIEASGIEYSIMTDGLIKAL